MKRSLTSAPVLCSFGLILGTGLAVYLFPRDKTSVPAPSVNQTDLNQEPVLPVVNYVKQSVSVQKNSTAYDTFSGLGLNFSETSTIIAAAKPYYDFSRVPTGLTIESFRLPEQPDRIAHLEVKVAADERLRLEKNSDGAWLAELIKLPTTKETVTFIGTVESSLWESAATAGMDPNLIGELATVFAWQVDFNREVRAGDKWRLVAEKQFIDGEHVGWGPIAAAEYQSADDTYTAIRYPKDSPHGAYYMPDGSSLRRMFLKSPIKFGRITSGFKRARFHPILKRSMPHNGVDYGAPVGTPVMSVGKGKVEIAGRRGGSGIMVRIRHNAVYKTAYLHLNAIAKGIKTGKTVEQGQIIGYVGATGLATGPHLHFAFFEHGVFVDPLGKKFPAADPVPVEKMDEFAEITAAAFSALPSWDLALQ